ncbi:MAG: zf-HC2 domain-containing protein [Verrucomicrobiota bacterium]
MSHPSREDWMAYLYGESSPETHQSLQQHLDVCPPCRVQMEAWQQTREALSTWELAPAVKRRRWTALTMRWAAAAVFVLGVGFGLGRLTIAAPDVEKLRAAIVSPLKEELHAEIRREMRADLEAALSANPSQADTEFRKNLQNGLSEWAARAAAASAGETQKLLADFARSYESARTEDRQAMLAVLKKMEQQRLADLANLRAAIETVAVVAENRLLNTQEQIGQLVAYQQNPPATETDR